MSDLLSLQTLVARMADLGAIYGRPITDAMVEGFYRVLAPHAGGVITAAIDAHLADPDRGRFFPTPADILAKAPGLTAAMSAEEAWAICLRSADEWATVISSDVIMEARAAVLPLLEGRDPVGARLAFVAAYKRVLAARNGHQQWFVSMGFDGARRDAVVQEAVTMGLMSQTQAARLGHDLPRIADGQTKGLPRC